MIDISGNNFSDGVLAGVLSSKVPLSKNVWVIIYTWSVD